MHCLGWYGESDGQSISYHRAKSTPEKIGVHMQGTEHSLSICKPAQLVFIVGFFS